MDPNAAEELPQLKVLTGPRVWAVLVPPVYLRPGTVAELESRLGKARVLVRYQENIIFLVSLAGSEETDQGPFDELRAVAMKIKSWLAERNVVADIEPEFASLDFGHLPKDVDAWMWRAI